MSPKKTKKQLISKEQQLLSVVTTEKPSTSTQTNEKKQMSTEQLTSLYSKCIQLSAQNVCEIGKNIFWKSFFISWKFFFLTFFFFFSTKQQQKIDQKNSWQLPLIEVLDDVLQVQPRDLTDITNFQAASVTLDASIKIYSNRVDSVYSTTKTLSAGFHNLRDTDESSDNRIENDQNNENHQKGKNQQNTDGEQDDKNGDDKVANDHNPANDENAEKSKKKGKESRRIRSNATSTLQSASNITLTKFDLAFEVDPLFSKTSAQFDEGGSRGLLLNHLAVFNDCEIIFDSNESINSESSELPKQPKMVSLVDIQGISEMHQNNSQIN